MSTDDRKLVWWLSLGVATWITSYNTDPVWFYGIPMIWNNILSFTSFWFAYKLIEK